MELKKFQQLAASEIIKRYQIYSNHPDRLLTNSGRLYPFFQSLASITGSGKTPMLAQTVSQLRHVLVGEPIILWMSKTKAVVEQTYNNFTPGGKYNYLLEDFNIIDIRNFTLNDLNNINKPLLLTLTTALFNNRDTKEGNLNLFKNNEDTFGGTSPWEALKYRMIIDFKRPLVVVYDEAHNLTEQQTKLLEELQPEAYLVSSATLVFPHEFIRDVINPYNSWAEKNNLIGYDKININTKEVVEESLIKKNIQFDGTTSSMEICLTNLNEQLNFLIKQAEGTGITPKAIYVCNTNIIDGGEIDDIEQPFFLRKAPPIKIWLYLVNELKVDPQTIAIYTSELKVHKYDLPNNFNLFGKGEDDFFKFSSGKFNHIIFNQSLQEGWDDPECYLGYIDKSIHSKIKISQIIGRILRQPNAKHYLNPALNTAHLYVRVDRRETFSDSVNEVKRSLGTDTSNIIMNVKYSNNLSKNYELSPCKTPLIGIIGINSDDANIDINYKIKSLLNYNENDQTAIGFSQISKKIISVSDGVSLSNYNWHKEKSYTRKVKLSWLISMRVKECSGRLSKIIKYDHNDFSKFLFIDSSVDSLIISVVKDVYEIYKNNAYLDYNVEEPYIFPTIRINPQTQIDFQNSVYKSYSGLNDFEMDFAKNLDSTGYTWHRNEPNGGYAIPLIEEGITMNFYPDFILWKDNLIYCFDTKGNHLLEESIKRKLFDIKNENTTKIITKFISKGKQSDIKSTIFPSGYTVWTFKNNQEKAIPCDSLDDVISICLKN